MQKSILKGTMTLEKSGGWICIYGTIKGHLVQERYMDYTEREATKKFKQKYKL